MKKKKGWAVSSREILKGKGRTNAPTASTCASKGSSPRRGKIKVGRGKREKTKPRRVTSWSPACRRKKEKTVSRARGARGPVRNKGKSIGWQNIDPLAEKSRGGQGGGMNCVTMIGRRRCQRGITQSHTTRSTDAFALLVARTGKHRREKKTEIS